MSLEKPQVGEVTKGHKLGYKNNAEYTYVVCPNCNVARWTQFPNRLCRSCSAVARNDRSTKRLNRGYKKINGRIRYKDTCPQCHRELWRGKEYLGRLCSHCTAVHNGLSKRGANSGSWKGGRVVSAYGYISVKIYPSNPYYPMADSHGYIPEHRLVVAQHLGRCLMRWEVVHHRNGIKTDNRLENLELVLQAKNVAYQLATAQIVKELQEKNKELEIRVEELEKQVRVLRFPIDTLRNGNPELAESICSRASVETLYGAPLEGEEKVQAL